MSAHDRALARLSEELRSDYADAPRGDKMTALHLFGITHAEDLARLNAEELRIIAEAAGSASFATELRKMVKLARFVAPREVQDHHVPLSASFERLARPLPEGYKFDREDANAR